MDDPWLSFLGLYKQLMCQRYGRDKSVNSRQHGAIVVQETGLFALFGCEFCGKKRYLAAGAGIFKGFLMLASILL
ncbi:hypothetical protein A1332_15145 [Methylomonas methanica]|uniref:Uncharacterized protein n=1 Tax=Methylomonas methanica TaxID=421 RepID=A0A177MG15_METMH|nr:hypothetical protein A1332_15145 [Methylomonas methanica]